jgi:integrase
MESGVSVIELGHSALERSASNAGLRTLTRAVTDLEAVAGWLAKYHDTPGTLANNQKEANRLLMWCADRGLELRGFGVEDAVGYQAFLRDPQPIERWCLQTIPRYLPMGGANPAWCQVQRVPRMLASGELNPAWRPFVSALSPSAARQSMTVLFGLFEHLSAVGYLAANPLRAARRRAAPEPSDVERYLDSAQWQTVLDAIEQMPRKTFPQSGQYARTRFVVRLLFLTGLRRAELTSARTPDLRYSRGSWWLGVIGKGHKAGSVPLPADAIETIREYRKSLGLSDWPAPGEDRPLLFDLTGKRAITAKAVHQIVTDLFRSIPDPHIQKASAHWLRHTAATSQLDAGVSLQVVQANLRHSSLATTEGYLHLHKDKQHAETERHRLPLHPVKVPQLF